MQYRIPIRLKYEEEELEVYIPEFCKHKDYCLGVQSLAKCMYGMKCNDKIFYDRYGKNADELGV